MVFVGELEGRRFVGVEPAGETANGNPGGGLFEKRPARLPAGLLAHNALTPNAESGNLPPRH